jgi:uncharacterized membrane protein
MSLIGSDADVLLWGTVFALVGIGFWAEQRTWIGKTMTGVIVAMSLAMLLSNLRIIPTTAGVYDTIYSDLLPLAIPLMLFRVNLRQVFIDGGPTLSAFLIGSFGVVLGVFTATALIPLGDLSAVTGGLLTATYTGGSANLAAVAIATDFNDSISLTAIVAADVIVTNFQTIFLIALPGLGIARWFHMKGQNENDNSHSRQQSVAFVLKDVNLAGLCLAISVSFILVEAGRRLALLFDAGSMGVLITTAFALAIGNFARPVVEKMSGDFEAGIVLIFLFLIAVGAGADIWVLAETGPVFFFYAAILLTVHTVFLLTIVYFTRLDLRAAIIGSTACIGGVTTAAAIASAKGWRDLILPGILVGNLGTALGSYLGVLMWSILQPPL